MNLQNKKILFISQFAAPYKGNFIFSFEDLAQTLVRKYNCQISWVFPLSVEKSSWFELFKRTHQCFCTIDVVKNSVDELYRIFLKEQPDLVHCNFDGYDIPVAKASLRYQKKSGRKIIQVWHLHDVMYYLPGFLHHVSLARYFALHYGYYGRYANCIGVSDEILRFSNPYRKLFFWKKRLCKVIPNGVVPSRFDNFNKRNHELFTFLAFGGRNIHKRIDLLVKAGDILYKEGFSNFRVIITKGTDTEDVVANVYQDTTLPIWLNLIDQNPDVSKVFEQADCFVSTSVGETFSFAVCEATFCKLPVIQSDIEGTMWNSKNPSTYLFQNENVDDLVVTMKKVLELDKKLLAVNCEKTRITNMKNYGIEVWNNNIIKFYNEI